MLLIGRTVRDDLEPGNQFDLDMPDGRTCRVWLLPNKRAGMVTVAIDAPADVRVTRPDRKPYPPVAATAPPKDAA